MNDFPLPEKDDPNMTTMKDVAKAAGVSIATVSRVLAGNVPVTESTQKKVYAAMEELQYHSSTLQHAPGKKNLSLVAVCVQDLSDPCCMDVLRGVEDVLSISGYLPLLFNVDHDRACCQELLETLPALRACGVVFIGCGAMLSEQEQLPDLPLVLVGEGTLPENGQQAVVCLDAAAAGALAARTLRETGKSRFLYLCGGEELPGQEEDTVYGSFCQVLEEKGTQAEYLSLTHRQAWERLETLLGTPEAPECLMIRDGLTAATVMQLLHKLGRRVPEEVSVLCLENSTLATLTAPPLSVAAPSGYQMGMVGAQSLVHHLEDEETLPPRVEVEPKLVKRGSLQ